jgi:rare lipoprotein A
MLRKFFVVLLGAFFCALSTTGPAWARTTVASWYGPGFEGSPTASGEPFSSGAHTAAHRTLPMHSVFEVCHEGCVDVRINDRGPHLADREIDLSAAAAHQIGVSVEGVAVVEVHGA